MRFVLRLQELQTAVRRLWADWAMVMLCALLLAFPVPGTVRFVSFSEAEIPTSSQEEIRHEAATQRRMEDSVSTDGTDGRSWLSVASLLSCGAARPERAASSPVRGHRLANGHNAPMAC